MVALEAVIISAHHCCLPASAEVPQQVQQGACSCLILALLPQGLEHKSSEANHTHTNGSLPKSALSQQSLQEKLAGSKALSAQAANFSPSGQKSMLPDSNGNSEEIIVQG